MKPRERREIAIKAYGLAKRGLVGKAIAERLKIDKGGYRSPGQHADELADLGRHLADIDRVRLTDNEMLLLRTLGAIEASQVEQGFIKSVKTKHVSWRARKYDGWCAATADRRLIERHPDEAYDRTVTRFGFVTHSRNGYIWLTDAGWAFVIAIGAFKVRSSRR
jgi:hypothetical protein